MSAAAPPAALLDHAALLALAPLLLAADSLGRGLDLSLLAALVLLPALVLARWVPHAARTRPEALTLIAATAVAAGGWVFAALLPRHGFAMAALAPLVVANAAWWQRLAQAAAAPLLYSTALLCLAPAVAGLLREALALAPLLQPLARQPAALFIAAACLLAACRAFAAFSVIAGNPDA